MKARITIAKNVVLEMKSSFDAVAPVATVVVEL
jgi:hypothetical protein